MSIPKFNWTAGIASLAIALWAGSLWSIGYLAAPVLFATLPDKMLAGMLAGKMFALVAWLGITCACYLLVWFATRHGKAMLRQVNVWLVIIMLALTCIGEFAIQPFMADLKAQAAPLAVMQSPLAGSFRMWHGSAELLYAVQSLLAVLLVFRSSRP
jgi:hypothetical protein